MDIEEIRRHIEFHKNETSLTNFGWHDGAILYLLHRIDELEFSLEPSLKLTNPSAPELVYRDAVIKGGDVK